jgi:acyl-coenzyme A synthetase/AMP-(fatty) acid ligase
MGIRPSDRNHALIPLGHSYGLGNLVMPLILQGTPIVCAQTIVPRQILQIIRDHRVTVFPTVPAVLRALAALDATKPPTLRLVISAGALLSADVARQFYERYRLKIHNFYGASETGGICYDRTGNATLAGRSVGKPLKGVRVRIRRDGRVVVGRQVLADFGEWNRFGELKLLGRVGVVANIGGKKVSPSEVERALRAVRGVNDAWVTVLKDSRGHDFIAAAVETEKLREEIDEALRGRLALWQLPKRYFLARALPRSYRGKLDTARLRARLEPTAPALR